MTASLPAPLALVPEGTTWGLLLLLSLAEPAPAPVAAAGGGDDPSSARFIALSERDITACVLLSLRSIWDGRRNCHRCARVCKFLKIRRRRARFHALASVRDDVQVGTGQASCRAPLRPAYAARKKTCVWFFEGIQKFILKFVQEDANHLARF